jgi:hypothetical protein
VRNLESELEKLSLLTELYKVKLTTSYLSTPYETLSQKRLLINLSVPLHGIRIVKSNMSPPEGPLGTIKEVTEY